MVSPLANFAAATVNANPYSKASFFIFSLFSRARFYFWPSGPTAPYMTIARHTALLIMFVSSRVFLGHATVFMQQLLKVCLGVLLRPPLWVGVM